MAATARTTLRMGMATIVAMAALTACASPIVATPVPGEPENAPTTVAEPSGYARTFITYYAAYDNDPPGSTEIAYGNERHPQAGGSGTFDDPLTLATDPNEIPPGTVVYYAAVRKYFVMEDDCAQCTDEWRTSKRPHVDLWMSSTVDKRVLDCEAAHTPDGLATIEVNPPRDRPVDPSPLFDQTGGCWKAAG